VAGQLESVPCVESLLPVSPDQRRRVGAAGKGEAEVPSIRTDVITMSNTPHVCMTLVLVQLTGPLLALATKRRKPLYC